MSRLFGVFVALYATEPVISSGSGDNVEQREKQVVVGESRVRKSQQDAMPVGRLDWSAKVSVVHLSVGVIYDG